MPYVLWWNNKYMKHRNKILSFHGSVDLDFAYFSPFSGAPLQHTQFKWNTWLKPETKTTNQKGWSDGEEQVPHVTKTTSATDNGTTTRQRAPSCCLSTSQIRSCFTAGSWMPSCSGGHQEKRWNGFSLLQSRKLVQGYCLLYLPAVATHPKYHWACRAQIRWSMYVYFRLSSQYLRHVMRK